MNKDNFKNKNTNYYNKTILMIMQTLIDGYKTEPNTIFEINGGNIDVFQFKYLEFGSRTVPGDHENRVFGQAGKKPKNSVKDKRTFKSDKMEK